MTDPQIRYRQLVETTRHNREQEDNWIRSLGETIRHDQEQEKLSKYQTETQAATSRYVADTNASTSRYSTDVSSGVSSQRSELEHLDRQARLEFDQATQRFQNELSAARLRMDRMVADANVMRSEADVSKITAQIEQIAQDMVYQAKNYRLDSMRTEAEVQLKRVQAIGAATRAGKDFASSIKDLGSVITSLAGLL